MSKGLHRDIMTHVSSQCAAEHDMIREDLLKTKLYGCPVSRIGYIFNFITGMRKNMAYKIAQNLVIEWKYIKSDILSDFDNIGLYDTICGIDKPFQEYREGPAVIFPEFISHLSNGHQIKLRVSLTICSQPHHSKIWVRISSVNGACTDPASLNDLDAFFGESEKISKKLINLFKSYYQKFLDKAGFPISLRKLYEVRIETAAADLGKTSEILSQPNFFMYDVFKKEINDELIGLFWRVFRKKISNFEELKALSEDNQWIRLNVHYNVNLIGICSKRNKMSFTEFICLVHCPANELLVSCEETIDSSKLLVRQIAEI